MEQYGDVALVRRFTREPMDEAAATRWVNAVAALHEGPVALRWGRETSAARGNVPEGAFEVVEYGLRFSVDIFRGSNVGLFLDARPLRRRVGTSASGRRVLNLFSYTSAFGVHAAAGGARSTTNVDLVPSTLERGAANYARNDLPTDSRTHVRADAFEFLKRAAGRGETWDLVVVDPPPVPTMKRGRKRGGRRGRFDPRRDWAALARGARDVVAPDGELLLLSAAFGEDGFERPVREALPDAPWRELDRAADHPGPRGEGLRALATVAP